ncbi:MAG: DUF167 domain-containing protein [Chloroherpetonaceae bacterium]|nr:DUF167 domain-containing protein [Chloroherpetonaceae bacterium]
MIITIKVKPNAKKQALFPPTETDSVWKAALKSPPVDGKANDELIELISEHFHVPKGHISIKKGISGRMKVVEIN